MTNELTDFQKQVISKKLDALRADYPVKALRLLMEDGTEWKIGNFPELTNVETKPPAAKLKRKRRVQVLEGKEFGRLSDMLRPWIELAMKYPEQKLCLRKHDLEGEDAMRCTRAISSMVGGFVGPGKVRTWTVVNEEGERDTLYFIYNGPAIEPENLKFWRRGVYNPEVRVVTRQYAVQPASQSGAINGADKNGI